MPLLFFQFNIYCARFHAPGSSACGYKTSNPIVSLILLSTPLYTRIAHFYYIDTSFLLENMPLVKFIKTTSGTRVVIFHNFTREFIDDVISVISLQNL